jgi:delta 1-pyrroline-5-carboxylate dehydrogenase
MPGREDAHVNPSDQGDTVAIVRHATFATVEDAVGEARNALPAWAHS